MISIEYFVEKATPLFAQLKLNFEDAQQVSQKNFESLNKLLYLTDRIIQESQFVRVEVNHLFDKVSSVHHQIKDALDHIQTSIDKDIQELMEKMAHPGNRKGADAVMHDFLNLVHTFEEDTKNLREQYAKMVHHQIVSVAEVLESFHVKMCQAMDISVSKIPNLVSAGSKPNLFEEHKKSGDMNRRINEIMLIFTCESIFSYILTFYLSIIRC